MKGKEEMRGSCEILQRFVHGREVEGEGIIQTGGGIREWLERSIGEEEMRVAEGMQSPCIR